MARDPHHVIVPGYFRGLAAFDAHGPILVTYYTGERYETGVAAAYDLTGTPLWRHAFAASISRPVCGRDGTAWVAHRLADRHVLTGLDTEGVAVRTVVLENELPDHLGAFLVLPDGFCAAWSPAQPYGDMAPGTPPRLTRHDADGRLVWSTPVVLGTVAYSGVVSMSAADNWEQRETKPWVPRSVQVGHPYPLMVSGRRIAATFECGHSGIGRTFVLDTGTGALVAATEPGPGGCKAICGPGEFLLGEQGYGAFRTLRVDASGAVADTWASHTQPLVDRYGGIRGPESENTLPSRSRFAALDVGGGVRRGAALADYVTTYPALDSDGTAVFHRDGRVWAAGPDLGVRELTLPGATGGTYAGRTLLMDGGLAVFGGAGETDGKLVFVPATGLGALDTGVWPCGGGGLGDNPVAFL